MYAIPGASVARRLHFIQIILKVRRHSEGLGGQADAVGGACNAHSILLSAVCSWRWLSRDEPIGFTHSADPACTLPVMEGLPWRTSYLAQRRRRSSRSVAWRSPPQNNLISQRRPGGGIEWRESDTGAPRGSGPCLVRDSIPHPAVVSVHNSRPIHKTLFVESRASWMTSILEGVTTLVECVLGSRLILVVQRAPGPATPHRASSLL